jgi:hypothetical protein
LREETVAATVLARRLPVAQSTYVIPPRRRPVGGDRFAGDRASSLNAVPEATAVAYAPGMTTGSQAHSVSQAR